MAMTRKEPVKGINEGDSLSQAEFVNEISGVSA
jgi:hypothetical protein